MIDHPLTIVTQVPTSSTSSRNYPIFDRKQLTLENSLNGYMSLSWELSRPFDVAYEDLALGCQVLVYNTRGRVVWQGILIALSPAFDATSGKLSCTAIGFWSNAYLLNFHGRLTSGTPENMIAQLISGGYIPQISTSTSGLITTGHSTKSYSSPNGGTDDIAVGDAILKICARGMSDGRRVVPAIWNDRKLITYAINYTSVTPRYIAYRANIEDLGLTRDITTITNRVTAKYKDTSGALARTTPTNDTTSQTQYGAVIDGVFYSYIRESVIDVSGIDGVDATDAASFATAKLNKGSRLKNSSRSIKISGEWSVFDTVAGDYITLAEVQPGQWLKTPDIYPRGLEQSGSGSTGGDGAMQTLFLVTRSSYVEDEYGNGELTLEPESAGNLADEESEEDQ